MTAVVDPAEAGAAELAARHVERGEIESALDERKATGVERLSCAARKRPTVRAGRRGVYLCAHDAVRSLMANGAVDAGVDPDRTNFTRTLHAARRSTRPVPARAARFPTTALLSTLTEI